MKASDCIDCNNYQSDETACQIGHKPRFYKPKSDPHDPDWGWKRKCADFVEKPYLIGLM